MRKVWLQIVIGITVHVNAAEPRRMYHDVLVTAHHCSFSRLDNNLEQRRDKGIEPLVGILTRLIISKVVVKVLLGCSSRTKKWEIRC